MRENESSRNVECNLGFWPEAPVYYKNNNLLRCRTVEWEYVSGGNGGVQFLLIYRTKICENSNRFQLSCRICTRGVIRRLGWR